MDTCNRRDASQRAIGSFQVADAEKRKSTFGQISWQRAQWCRRRAFPESGVGARTELAVGDQKHRGLCQEGEDVIGWALDVNYLVASCKQLGTSPCISATQSRSMGQLRQQVSLGDISRILSRSHHLFIISHAFSMHFPMHFPMSMRSHEIPWDPGRGRSFSRFQAPSGSCGHRKNHACHPGAASFPPPRPQRCRRFNLWNQLGVTPLFQKVP